MGWKETTSPYDRLWQNLARVAEPPPTTVDAWQALPPPQALPSPWVTWTLLGLFRHRQRQLWVGRVVDLLGGSLTALAQAGAMGHPDRPQRGPVPGHPEWEYFFHGRGCCLTHRVSGEEIDVDFYDNSAEHFDFFFYTQYLKSLRAPEPPEQRLLALHPSVRAVHLAMDDLVADGLLIRSEATPPRLEPGQLIHEPLVQNYCQNPGEGLQQVWQWALAGDWLAVATCPATVLVPGLAALAASRAACVQQMREVRLLAQFRQDPRHYRVLQALADLPSPELPNLLRQALRGPIEGVVSTALEIIEQQPDAAAWCQDVQALFFRLDPAGEIPHPYFWVRCARFLLTWGFQTEQVIVALSRAGPGCAGEAALLALEHAPGRALDLFRRALRSLVPNSRTKAAAALAILDQPWARRELLAVLAESEDQEMTSACRSALAESADPAARQAVLGWERRNPHEPEPGPWITTTEMMLRQSDDWMRAEIETLRERVRPLADRNVEPGGRQREFGSAGASPTRVEVVEGDLLDQDVEVIVNAWNRNIIPWWLLLPQGVSGAIKKRAGYAPFRELAKHGAIPLGGAVLTGAGRLPFKGIIHVAGIGMLWRSSERSIQLSVRHAIELAQQHGFRSIGFPLIGAGTGGGRPERVLRLMQEELGKVDYDGLVRIVRYAKRKGRG